MASITVKYPFRDHAGRYDSPTSENGSRVATIYNIWEKLACWADQNRGVNQGEPSDGAGKDVIPAGLISFPTRVTGSGSPSSNATICSYAAFNTPGILSATTLNKQTEALNRSQYVITKTTAAQMSNMLSDTGFMSGLTINKQSTETSGVTAFGLKISGATNYTHNRQAIKFDDLYFEMKYDTVPIHNLSDLQLTITTVPDIAAGGGAVVNHDSDYDGELPEQNLIYTVKAKYSDSSTWEDVTAESDTTNFCVSANTLGTTVKARTKIGGNKPLTATYGGLSATSNVDVYQQANEVTGHVSADTNVVSSSTQGSREEVAYALSVSPTSASVSSAAGSTNVTVHGTKYTSAYTFDNVTRGDYSMPWSSYTSTASAYGQTTWTNVHTGEENIQSSTTTTTARTDYSINGAMISSVTLTQTTANNNSTVRYYENTGVYNRNGQVIYSISGVNNTESAYTIDQAHAPLILSAYYGTEGYETTIDIPYWEQYVTFRVITNEDTPWEATTDDGWARFIDPDTGDEVAIVTGRGSMEIDVIVDENDESSYNSRYNGINVENVYPSYPYLYTDLQLTQRGVYNTCVIDVRPSNYLSAVTSSGVVNTSYSVYTEYQGWSTNGLYWVTITPNNIWDSGNTPITITVDPNTGENDRSGVIYFYGKDGISYDVLNVSQLGTGSTPPTPPTPSFSNFDIWWYDEGYENQDAKTIQPSEMPDIVVRYYNGSSWVYIQSAVTYSANTNVGSVQYSQYTNRAYFDPIANGETEIWAKYTYDGQTYTTQHSLDVTVTSVTVSHDYYLVVGPTGQTLQSATTTENNPIYFEARVKDNDHPLWGGADVTSNSNITWSIIAGVTYAKTGSTKGSVEVKANPSTATTGTVKAALNGHSTYGTLSASCDFTIDKPSGGGGRTLTAITLDITSAPKIPASGGSVDCSDITDSDYVVSGHYSDNSVEIIDNSRIETIDCSAVTASSRGKNVDSTDTTAGTLHMRVKHKSYPTITDDDTIVIKQQRNQMTTGATSNTDTKVNPGSSYTAVCGDTIYWFAIDPPYENVTYERGLTTFNMYAETLEPVYSFKNNTAVTIQYTTSWSAWTSGEHSEKVTSSITSSQVVVEQIGFDHFNTQSVPLNTISMTYDGTVISGVTYIPGPIQNIYTVAYNENTTSVNRTGTVEFSCPSIPSAILSGETFYLYQSGQAQTARTIYFTVQSSTFTNGTNGAGLTPLTIESMRYELHYDYTMVFHADYIGSAVSPGSSISYPLTGWSNDGATFGVTVPYGVTTMTFNYTFTDIVGIEGDGQDKDGTITVTNITDSTTSKTINLPPITYINQ